MNLLLHVCCAPCTTYPLKVLREAGVKAQGFFYNPNIHPYQEFKRRLVCVEDFSQLQDFPLVIVRDYGLKEFLREVVYHEAERCRLCYEIRLRATALKARETGADAFSTTLLYSRYQKHDLIRRTAEQMAKEYGIPFYYRDFREGWQEGIDLAKELELYRQPYCGCIYSEQERYDKALRGRLKKE